MHCLSYLRSVYIKRQKIIYITLIFITFTAIFMWPSITKVSTQSNLKSLNSSIQLNTNSVKSIIMIGDYPGFYDDTTDFMKLNCNQKNCVIAKYSEELSPYMVLYDALLYTDASISCEQTRKFKHRLPWIKYTYVTNKTPNKAPACEPCLDNFFNWTLTRRLDSDVVWTDFVVKNSTGHIIAPSKDVQWKTSQEPTKPEVIDILAKKNKTAAWYVNNCRSSSDRDEYLLALQEHLFQKGVQIDIFGPCSHHTCSDDDCDDTIKRDYVFYMAFEDNSMEEYVTDIVLRGYDNYAVPIVFGGANYIRFLPPGSYIVARNYDPRNLAEIMYKTAQDKSKLAEYFKWRNLYTIESSHRTDGHPLCRLCAALHDEEKAKYAPAKKNFRTWFNGLNGMMWCISASFWNETANLTL